MGPAAAFQDQELPHDHNTSKLEDRYGIAIDEPNCGPGTPAPVWAELMD